MTSGDWLPGTGDFTEAAFAGLLKRLIEQRYTFARYGETAAGKHVLWRHDLDFSVHRARALARIERAHGAVGIYFVNPRSAYYNVFEAEISALLNEIIGLGHVIGLHFDPAAHGGTVWDLPSLESAVTRDRSILELACGATVSCVSWHNPDRSNVLAHDSEQIAGLDSAYSKRVRETYRYCSDSNGYWRFAPMSQVILEGHERLHLLTHPEWWTPDELSPWERTLRCTQGRAAATLSAHEALLASAGRTIPGKPD